MYVYPSTGVYKWLKNLTKNDRKKSRELDRVCAGGREGCMEPQTSWLQSGGITLSIRSLLRTLQGNISLENRKEFLSVRN